MKDDYRLWARNGFKAQVIPLLPLAKAPGRWAGGEWGNLRDWPDIDPDLRTWASWPDHNIGLRTSAHPAIDIDIDDPSLADTVAQIFKRCIGSAPERRRGDARRALLYRLADGAAPVRFAPLLIDGGHKVEIISAGRQLAVYGRVKDADGVTRPYVWDELPVSDNLIEVDTDRVTAAMNEVKDALALLGLAFSGGDAMAVIEGEAGQQTKIDTDTVIRILKEAPNELAALHGGGREAMTDVMMGAKGCVDEADWGRLWSEGMLPWLQKWPDWRPDQIKEDRAAFDSFKPDRAGLPLMLRGLGDIPNPLAAEQALELFEAEPIEWSPALVDIDQFRIPADLAQLATAAAVPPDWVVKNLVLRGRGSALVGPPGKFKSAWALMLAVAKATGIQRLIGDDNMVQVGAAGRVLLYNDEDGRDKLHRQIQALVSTYDLTADEYARLWSNLFVWSGCDDESLRLAERVGHDKVQEGPGFRKVVEFMEKAAIELLICDPLVRLQIGLNENSNSDMDQFTQIVRKIGLQHRAGVLITHHTSKGGGNTAVGNADMSRGAGALTAGWRVQMGVRPLTDKQAKEDRVDPRIAKQAVVLSIDKSNDGPTGEIGWHKADIIQTGGPDAVAAILKPANYELEIKGSMPKDLQWLQDLAEELGPCEVSLVDLRAVVKGAPPTSGRERAEFREMFVAAGVPVSETAVLRLQSGYTVRLEELASRSGGWTLYVDRGAEFNTANKEDTNGD